MSHRQHMRRAQRNAERLKSTLRSTHGFVGFTMTRDGLVLRQHSQETMARNPSRLFALPTLDGVGWHISPGLAEPHQIVGAARGVYGSWADLDGLWLPDDDRSAAVMVLSYCEHIRVEAARTLNMLDDELVALMNAAPTKWLVVVAAPGYR